MSNIYILPYYANNENLKENRYPREHISSIRFTLGGFHIELSETNSLVEDRYSLNLNSAKYVVEGNYSEQKEAMIHHHPHGHLWKHLQFKLKARNEVIRIKLDALDDEDYQKCIKGFLHISQKIIQHEKQENQIKEDLQKYFFNDEIKKLAAEEIFLLSRIKLASEDKGILDSENKPLDAKRIEDLKTEKHLLPFFEWER